ncbi:MAG TPA: ABC transporter permease [Candidatus Acidoferrales bacterium]|nr:ABC transporter permease [Candidatus Acidoferrales bacterium]
MKVINILKIAYRSLGRNKLRSFLTMLGIIIGVAAVIAMLAIGQGASNAVKAQIASLGTNMLIVFPGASNQSGVRTQAATFTRFTEDDAIAISKQCPAVEYVTPVVRSVQQTIANNQNWRTAIWGGYPNYFNIRAWPLQSGSYFTGSDERGETKVCIVGQTIVTNLFGANSVPVGQTIRIGNLPFRIIGVLSAKGQDASGNDQDDIIIAPFSTVLKKLVGGIYANVIFASAISEDAINEASDEITALIRDRHKLTTWEANDFTVRTQTQIASTADATTQTMTLLLASIAGISLIVGGIGIMNIMLVSVTERTREIGIRMAVGARGNDVLTQFLIEALTLSFAGGLIGIVLGVLTSQFVSNLQKWPIVISPQSIGLAFAFAAAIGIFFGWYPARKAANLNPIEALRYE